MFLFTSPYIGSTNPNYRPNLTLVTFVCLMNIHYPNFSFVPHECHNIRDRGSNLYVGMRVVESTVGKGEMTS